MKFILNEAKFILNESKRFLLEERFILKETNLLTEATDVDVAKKWTDQFIKTLDSAEAVFKKYAEYAGLSKNKVNSQNKLKEIKKAITDLENSLELPTTELEAELPTIKTELYSLIKSFSEIDKIIKVTDDNEDSLDLLKTKKTTELTQIYNKQSWDLNDIKKLKQFSTWLAKNILPLFNDTGLEETNKVVEKFKTDCVECIKLIETFKKDLPTDFASFSDDKFIPDLKAYWSAIKQATESVKDLKDAQSINKGLVISNLGVYQKQVEVIKTNYTAITETNIFKQYSEMTEAERKRQEAERKRQEAEQKRQEISNGSSDNWKEKYVKAVDKEAVIEEFIYTTWKNNADKVIKIKKALTQECVTYGFRQSNDEGKNGNPFIKFISDIYLKYEVITPNAYNIIHNLVAGLTITTADLAGAGKLKKNNLLFCKALYSLDPATIKLYLKKQSELLKTTKTPDSDIFKSIPELVFNILYKLPKLTTGSEFENNQSSENLAINTLDAIENLELQWLGEVSEIPKDDKEIKNTVAAPAELLKQITTTNEAIDVLVALAVKFSSNDEIIKAVKSCAEVVSRMAKATTLEDTQKLVAKIERLYKIEKISATQALTLIKSILESDQFSLTKN